MTREFLQRIWVSRKDFFRQACDKGFRKDLCLNLKKGDIVEVRSRREILETLDPDGALEGLPFLSEMNIFCGRRFRVLKRVNKLLVEGEKRMARIRDAVILVGVVCDGEAHDGCQRYCPTLWKKAWLKKVR